MRRFLILCALLVAVRADAQTITGDRFQLNTGPCTVRSGSGAPASGLGAVCDTYYRTDSPYTVYVKTGASTWSPVVVEPGSSGITTVGTLTSGAIGTAFGAIDVGSDSVAGATGVFSTSVTTPILTNGSNLTLSPTGDVIFNPTGNDLLPTTGYDLNIGALTTKFLTLHAAELWVETLVAQNTIATIGGRVLVGPTTTLVADLGTGATTINVKHNQMANGDRVYMEADGKVEFMAIASGASGSAGNYTYTVTRNLDGSGANQWYAGDAVFNTGTTGDGYIDLYSVSGVNAGSTVGPTIVGNVRTGTTYSNIEPRWAIGNLNGTYGYSADTYGAAFGDTNNAWVKIDPTNGVRIGENATTYFSVDPSGNALFAGNLTVGTGRNVLANTEFGRGRGAGDSYSSYWGGSSATATVDPSASYTCAHGSGSPASCSQRASHGSGWSWTGFNHQTSLDATIAWGGTTAPLGGAHIYFRYVSGTPSNTQYAWLWGPVVPVDEDKPYEFSAYIGMSGSWATNVYIVWYGADGGDAGDQPDYISEDVGSTTCTTGTASVDIGAWCRAFGIFTPPSGARLAALTIMSVYDGGDATPITYVTRPFFAEARSGQTEPTPWGPGGQTLITGDMLSTDLAIANTIRSSGATALATGTGFWLDATSTPTFRVGNPSGNHFKWDGTDLTATSANFSFGPTGVLIQPTDTLAWTLGRSYAWNVPTGELGVSGSDGATNGRRLLIKSLWSGTGDKAVVTQMLSDYQGSVGSPSLAAVTITASSLGAEITLGGEVEATGVSGDGTGKVVCVKSDGNLGTCNASSIGASTCTCS